MPHMTEEEIRREAEGLVPRKFGTLGPVYAKADPEKVREMEVKRQMHNLRTIDRTLRKDCPDA